MLIAHQQSALAGFEQQQLTERSALGVFFNS
jgi:hypothetical protein